MTDQRNGGIAWCDESWNPIRGCSRVSDGCRNCYAEKVAARFSGPGLPYEGLVTIGEKGPRWNGTVRLVPEHLGDPLRWKRPRRVFVNSMSDLFHESLPFETIAAVYGVMAAAPQHTFQVLTKRPERAREFFAWIAEEGEHLQAAVGEKPPGGSPVPAACAMYVGRAFEPERDIIDALTKPGLRAAMAVSWPLPNVWLGVSVENQVTADERIPLLLECPAAVRWVSAEPLLGPVNLELLTVGDGEFMDSFRWRDDEDGLDWIVVGGESGPGARPFDIQWARSIVGQCRDAGVPVFVKQLGNWPYVRAGSSPGWSAQMRLQVPGAPLTPCRKPSSEMVLRALLSDRKGGDPTEWPEDLRVRQWPEVA